MSYKLIPPGKRHGNRVYYAVVRVKGRRREVSTDTRDPKLARRFAEQVEAAMYERDVLGSGASTTLAEAIDAYLAFRRPSANDRRYIDLIRRHLGRRQLHQIGQLDFDQTAQALYPNGRPETWNRHVYTPLQAVLSHAGVNLKLRRPKQRKPRNRAVGPELAHLLIDNAKDEDLAALLTLLFYTGCRISEAIALTPDRIDLAGRRLCFDLGKTDENHWRPMHDRVFEVIASLPKREDRIFRWSTTSGPQKPLRKLRKQLGVTFTFHMARHSFATWLAERGTNIDDIMQAGGWADYKSVLRYMGANVERVRRAVDKL